MSFRHDHGIAGMPRRPFRRTLSALAVTTALAVCLSPSNAPAAKRGNRKPAGWKTCTTKYYIIHSDLDADSVREAALRLTAMAREYHRRTKGFGGTIRKKLPFHLYSKAEDYIAAGGIEGSAGVFMGDCLMAVAGEKVGPNTWSIVQHEGFHQFARYAIRGHLPVWVNEGLAEYFGEGLFTGDGFVVGVVPPHRLRRLRQQLSAGKLKSLKAMMQMDQLEWNRRLQRGNYDQAWSMIHFLVHAEDGKYVKRLSRFINDLRRMRQEQAWVRSFGRDIKGFEEKWRDYWLSLPDNPTANRYARATVATLTSFLARLPADKRFEEADAFLRALAAGEVSAARKDWLPPSLGQRAASGAPRLGQWSFQKAEQGPTALVLTRPDGSRLTGTYVFRNGKVRSVKVTVTEPSSAGKPK